VNDSDGSQLNTYYVTCTNNSVSLVTTPTLTILNPVATLSETDS